MHPLLAYAAPVEAGPLPGEVHDAAEFLEVGVGKAACAHALTLRLATDPRPEAVVLFGVCGAHAAVESPLDVLDLCLVGEDCLADEGAATADGFRSLEDLGLPGTTRFAMDVRLTEALAARLDEPPIVTGATVSTCAANDADARRRAAVTATRIETMEGAAAALVCDRLGVPFVQLRCVSNRTGDRGRAGWDLPAAAARVQAAVRRILANPWPS